MDIWRYLPYTEHSGAENMAIDEAIMLGMAQGTQTTPTLRFYGWNPPALSLGYSQSFAKEVSEQACQAAGIDIVRRPTGGRAVLHQYELTYSIIAPEGDVHVKGTVVQSYLKISRALLRGFQALGIPAEMTAHGNKPTLGSAACFDAPSWYELVADDRKLVGSAQMRKRGILLQHGSIILHLDIERLFSLLKFPNEAVQQRLQTAFKTKACALDEVCTHPIRREELEQEICRGFMERMHICFKEAQLTPAETDQLEVLTAKYRSDEWNKLR